MIGVWIFFENEPSRNSLKLYWIIGFSSRMSTDRSITANYWSSFETMDQLFTWSSSETMDQLFTFETHGVLDFILKQVYYYNRKCKYSLCNYDMFYHILVL